MIQLPSLISMRPQSFDHEKPGLPIRRGQGAFTLMELLVVVGIIAVLIGLLIPALTNVRQKTDQVRCLSNLRELGAMFHSYAADNNGMLPAPASPATDTKAYWRWQLLPYMGLDPNNSLAVNQTTSLCPAVARIIVSRGGKDRVSGSRGISSFGMNYYLSAVNSAGGKPISLLSVTGARLLLATEASLGTSPTATVPNPYLAVGDVKTILNYHSGANNVLYVDGSVERWPDGSALANSPYAPLGTQDVWYPDFRK